MNQSKEPTPITVSDIKTVEKSIDILDQFLIDLELKDCYLCELIAERNEESEDLYFAVSTLSASMLVAANMMDKEYEINDNTIVVVTAETLRIVRSPIQHHVCQIGMIWPMIKLRGEWARMAINAAKNSLDDYLGYLNAGTAPAQTGMLPEDYYGLPVS